MARGGNPFERHPIRRYSYAWERVQGRGGRHLDIGCNSGEFLHALSATTSLDCHGIDAHAGYLEAARRAYPELKLEQAPRGDFALPYADGFFGSVTLLDTLEHVRDETRCLEAVNRVLVPGGIVIVTVPHRHLFSFMDPDNAKYRWPRLHRWIYTKRFGREVYHTRFLDLSDGLRGDIAAEKTEHTNYATPWLTDKLRQCGFEPVDISGANLFWRFFQVPALLVRNERVRKALEWCIYWDGRVFSAANLFITARKRQGGPSAAALADAPGKSRNAAPVTG